VVPVPRTVVLLLVALVPGAVAFADVLRDGDTDLAILLGTVLVLLTLALASALRDRRAVVLRADLAGWLRRRSAATGEPVGRLADRCVAAYRASLTTAPAEGVPGDAA
jgi:hypothetical protein